MVPPVAHVRVWFDTTKPGHNTVASRVALDLEANAWPVLIKQVGSKAPLDDTLLLGCYGGDAGLDVNIVEGMAARGLAPPERLAFFQAPISGKPASLRMWTGRQRPRCWPRICRQRPRPTSAGSRRRTPSSRRLSMTPLPNPEQRVPLSEKK